MTMTKQVRAKKHIDDNEIVEAVAIDVRKINTHRREARFANALRGERFELPMTIVDPDPVRRITVIADIYIRGAVTVDVAEHHREAPIVGEGHGMALFIRKSVGPGGCFEMAAAIVEVEHVRFAALTNGHRFRIDGIAPSLLGVGRAAIDGTD